MAGKPDRSCPKCAARNRKAGRAAAPVRTATRTESQKCPRCGEPIEVMITHCLTPDCDYESVTEMRPAHTCRGR